MEATKKTATTRTLIVVAAALSMLLSGLFVATASQSDATPPPACPDGFTLTADEKNCYQPAVITSADNPNTCEEGLLTPDGTKCYIAARILTQSGETICPDGYSPDDSLGGMCARFETASQHDPGCPDGARGKAGGCYILVAKGPAGASTCSEGTLVGDNCVVTGDAPTAGTATCPTSSTVKLDNGSCYSVVSHLAGSATCQSTDGKGADYAIFGGTCKASNDHEGANSGADWECPEAATGREATAVSVTIGSTTKISYCTYAPLVPSGGCPSSADLGEVNGECRRSVALVPGAKNCAAGFGLVDNKCIRYVAPTTTNAQCPKGSAEDLEGDCRQPVADSSGAYYCKDSSASLNGKSCLYVTGFTIKKAANMYKCDKGTRAVIGEDVICFLGDAQENTTSGPSCLQGVLSTDNKYCIVPRIDSAPAAAAPVPSFTG